VPIRCEGRAQIEFWERAAKDGLTDESARASTLKFRAEFDVLEDRLAQQPYLMRDQLSVVDIACFMYAHRLSLAGYPFRRLHCFFVGLWIDHAIAVYAGSAIGAPPNRAAIG
jgi:glutathione S-transferase